jgi:outer membrane protein
MKLFKTLLAICFFITTNLAFAKSNLNSDYYEDEGQLLFKIRGFYASTNAKPKNLPTPTNANTKTPSKLARNGFGLDVATTYFFNDNIAAELSLGAMLFRVKSSTLEEIFNAYGNGGTKKISKNNELYMIPLAATLQYHIAPYGGVRPYVGAGFNATYMYSRSKAFKSRPGYGPVLQLGVDLVSRDDTFFTFDVRQYFLSSKLTYKNDFLGGKSITSKVTWNPMIVSAGFGFRL